MDAVTVPAGVAPESPAPALPPDSPLAMPVQSLRAAPAARLRPTTAPARLAARRAFVFGGALALTALAAEEMYAVLNVAGLTVLETVVLVLFVVLFAWIAFSFTNALGGAIAMARRGDGGLGIDPASPLPELTGRIALLMPTYNEAPARVFAGLEATWQSLVATGRSAAFDLFILSDTTDADVWVAEEAGFLALRARAGGDGRMFYRRRPRNIDRKAGNIADWVMRFGGGYDSMIVLDADSVMTGEAMVRIAAAMEQNPGVGLIQTLPVIVGGRSLFARVQQFAGRLYGPLIAHGLAWWHGPDGNYWGHNAIIRVRAFAGEAGLPHLKGRKPFGGHILSHDFVEAALIRRGGWAVHMVPALAGSFEEGPPSLMDLSVRDRRWCQGNLQHIAVLPARGLHPLSRLHLLTGIGAYVTAPLWLAMLLIGLLAALQARFVPPDYFPTAFSLFPEWPAQDPVRAAWVFVGTMAVLLLPKLIGYALMLADRDARRGFGVFALVGVVAETAISALTAPITMVSQSAAVAGILAGRDAGWQPQRRDDGTMPFAHIARRFAPHTLFGLALAGAAFAISPELFLWMTPVIAGLVLAVPVAALTASRGAGRALAGLLRTPEGRNPPEVLRRAADLAAARAQETVGEAVAALARDPELLAAHHAMLPAGGARRPGDYAPERLVARAKIEDARDLNEALALLTPREKAAALGDPDALERLVTLAR
ncbi:glucans biosynthesis glucosyltransferase MdoH [Blastochloris viridis]|uniref:Glucans biosynthesis glucosyltransferase H n=1 Tax=Blastochloris viridis TaxID=1079 RepID=A0A0N7IU33_BLAVI|nr:glucans biosynthesis glucosyltransferase MdoH [Blastochloris viridis]ALK08238.1 Glucans biosynthesis glucosyltransferase H [Blastochloris viridis]CUU44160.1 Glucans biosynthesis glucosyltransferase H [Blastochloris viridis]